MPEVAIAGGHLGGWDHVGGDVGDIPFSPTSRRARASEVSSRTFWSPLVLTKRVVLAFFAPEMTSRARFSWMVRVFVIPDCALGGVGPHRPPRARMLAPVPDRLGTLGRVVLDGAGVLGVMVSMSCPSVKASPCQRKWEARSMGALVARDPAMKVKPASSRAVRFVADSIPRQRR